MSQTTSVTVERREQHRLQQKGIFFFDFFFFFTNNSDCKLATKPTCKQTVDCCFWVHNVCNAVRVCACVVCGGRTIEVIVWIYFQCAEWIFEYSVSKCVIGIVAVISYTANNDKMVQWWNDGWKISRLIIYTMLIQGQFSSRCGNCIFAHS